jgi:hypothetical protein
MKLDLIALAQRRAAPREVEFRASLSRRVMKPIAVVLVGPSALEQDSEVPRPDGAFQAAPARQKPHRRQGVGPDNLDWTGPRTLR